MSKFRYREMRSLVLGPKLGEGSARKVYLCRMNPEYVVKVEMGGCSFQNVAEWDIWNWVRGGSLEKWFAPCEMISTCGSILVQRRTEPVRSAELPKRVPEFLTDLKVENFGMFNGRIVCFDYGTVSSCIRRTSRKMVKATWL